MKKASTSVKVIIVIALAMLLVLLASQIGCAHGPAATEILSQSVYAMENVRSYHLSSNVLREYRTIGGSSPGTSSINWVGDNLVDSTNKEMHESMRIESTNSIGETTHWTLESYNAGGYFYYKANSDVGVSNTFGVWFKSKADNTDWADYDPVNLLHNLMKTSNGTALSGSEKIDGVECYVLEIHPSIQTIVPWVETQFRGFGGADYSTGPGLHGKEDYLRFFESGSFEVWVGRSNYLVMKAHINPKFQATAQELGAVPGIPQSADWTSVESEFLGEMEFSAYNQPVSIEVPTEAADAG